MNSFVRFYNFALTPPSLLMWMCSLNAAYQTSWGHKTVTKLPRLIEFNCISAR